MWIGMLLGLAVLGCAAVADEPRPVRNHRPNIVVILSDDMGWSDVGCYGGEIETPAIDALAAGGVRFTQFYNGARCCPTRAQLLTGLYAHQAGVGYMVGREVPDQPGYRGDLAPGTATLAEVLAGAGYGTYMAGKWHVSRNVGPAGERDSWPTRRGFERYYGILTGAASYYDPGTLMRDEVALSPFDDPEYQPDGEYYLTDAISEHAVRYVRDHHTQRPDEPFFLYVSYTAAHWPLHASDADVARYRGRYDGGYEQVRAERLDRLRALGLLDERWTPAPLEWEFGRDVSDTAWEARCMEVYAAQVTAMDRGIGQLVATLRETGALEETLIVYLQDNGGCHEGYGREAEGDGPRPGEPTLEAVAGDEVKQWMFPDRTRDGFPVRAGVGVMPGPADTYLAYGRGWAGVSNTPFRKYKHWVHEGGSATPFIAHWPAGFGVRGGELEPAVGHVIDLMPTVVELAGAVYPSVRAGAVVPPTEGRSLVPALMGEALNEDRTLFWEHAENRAVRAGNWKLVAEGRRGAFELYDLEADRGETQNLAGERPEVVMELEAEWDAWAERCGVLPIGAWRNKPQVSSEARARLSFELAPDARLAREASPWLMGRDVVIEARIDGPAPGVLVAQGGSSHGWALYVQDDRLVLSLRQSGKLTRLAAPEALPASARQVGATLAATGELALVVEGEVVARGAAKGLLDEHPADGLEVGRDETGAVGAYAVPYAFEGTLRGVRTELSEPADSK